MVSFIITYREKDEFRRKNLDYLVAQLKQLAILDMEIIVVEQDRVEKYKNPEVHKIFLNYSSIYNKSRACNFGAEEAKNSFLFFNDCDIMMPAHNYFDALKQIIDYDIVNPYSTIRYYDRTNTESMIRSGIGSFEKVVTPSIISGGAFLIRKSVFADLKGFDEACIGFGYEDTIFDTKIQKLGYKIKTIKENYSMHFYHPAPPLPTGQESLEDFINRLGDEDEYYWNFKNNKKLYESYEDMSIEQLKQKLNEKHT
jgi:predicted glycosyltransferase involved in capsule biosynthesis